MDRKISSIKAVGFLDVMCAFAGYARATGAVKPELTEEIFSKIFRRFSIFEPFSVSQFFSTFCHFSFSIGYGYGTSFIAFLNHSFCRIIDLQSRRHF